MENFVITGDCNGLTYYMQVLAVYREGFAPDFQWNGLINNATRFPTEQIARNAMRDAFPYVKISMAVKSFTRLSNKTKHRQPSL